MKLRRTAELHVRLLTPMVHTLQPLDPDGGDFQQDVARGFDGLV